MHKKLLDVLACPKCQGDLCCTLAEVSAGGEIVKGQLCCDDCHNKYPIESGIPRFVDGANYASSFGYQWNRFKREQIDSFNGTGLSGLRFYGETGWTKEWMNRKWILDAGCGAGRFLDVASQTGADVVGVDISNAVDAARMNMSGRQNVHLVQASIYELPFRQAAFDGCYCIGVIQHTPDPIKSLRSLPRILKKDGRLALTIYEKKPWTKLHSKYLFRIVTKRIDQAALLRIISLSMPILFPLTSVLFRLPYLSRGFGFAIPVANYVRETRLTSQQRYSWAILDTFDMLSPQYDQPQRQEDVEVALLAEGITEISRAPTPGLTLIGKKG